MEDMVLKAQLDDVTKLYVSPISRQTYDEHVQDDSLGGERGYFVMRSRSTGTNRLEILAMAPTLDAAEVLFDLTVASRR